MAGGISLQPRVTNAQSVATVANTTGTGAFALTSGSSVNTWGAWTELSSGSPTDVGFVHILLDMTISYNVAVAYEIGIGPAGSEIPVISNLVRSEDGPGTAALALPISFPAGTRISARLLSPVANDVASLDLITFDTAGTSFPAGPVDTFGYSGSGAPQGLVIDPGATANAMTSWLELTASTPADLAGFVIGADCAGQYPVNENLYGAAVLDIGIGAAGSEQVIIPKYNFYRCFSSDSTFAAGYITPGYSTFFPLEIAAGTRIAVRGQSSLTDSKARLFAVSLYGVRK